jgi:hypothetical protein
MSIYVGKLKNIDRKSLVSSRVAHAKYTRVLYLQTHSVHSLSRSDGLETKQQSLCYVVA